MTAARRLLDEVLAGGLVLEPHPEVAGGSIRIRSPLGKPIPADLAAEVRAHKEELLALLARRQRAIRLVERWLAQAEGLWRAGARLEGGLARHLEERITAAFWAAVEEGDLTALRKALAAHLAQMQAARAA